jgi:hypothetical protein
MHRRYGGAPTNASDLLSAEVLQQGLDGRIVSGVQLISVNTDVEFEPVGIEIHCCLPSGQEFCTFSTFVWPTKNEDGSESRRTARS